MKVTFSKLLTSFFLGLFFFGCVSNLPESQFPESWEGKYQGDLLIFGVDSVNMKVSMGLEIKRKTDSVYQWKMKYEFKGNEDIRDYDLVIVDRSKGVYMIDEKNSILIDAYYKSGYFTSLFEVMDSYIMTSYTKMDEDLEFEIVAASGRNVRSSGNTVVEGDSIPQVLSYPINGRQRGFLRKVD